MISQPQHKQNMAVARSTVIVKFNNPTGFLHTKCPRTFKIILQIAQLPRLLWRVLYTSLQLSRTRGAFAHSATDTQFSMMVWLWSCQDKTFADLFFIKCKARWYSCSCSKGWSSGIILLEHLAIPELPHNFFRSIASPGFSTSTTSAHWHGRNNHREWAP